MRRSTVAASMAATALLGAVIALAQPGGRLPATRPTAVASTAAGTCGACHAMEGLLFARSRHAQGAVRCVSCHGGNDGSFEEGVAHGRGFVGRPKPAQVPRLCASCHASEEKMRPYHLSVDQLTLYQTSQHGRRLAGGDTRAAVCTDCHGAHDILPSDDPTSRVFPLNIPRTCGRCHGDSTLMVRERHHPDTYREYLGSAHGRELLEHANRQAPTCVTCHGVHGAAPNGAGGVDRVCGQCHMAEHRYFAAGPHREKMFAAGLPECASCHVHHDVQTAGPGQLATLCATCHGGGSTEAAMGVRMWTSYQAAATQLDQADGLIARAGAAAIATEDYRARLEEGRTYLRDALPAAHSVDEQAVVGFTTRARLVGAEVAAEVQGKLGRLPARRVGLVVLWITLGLAVLILRRLGSRAARKA